jgi:hypothetical protein
MSLSDRAVIELPDLTLARSELERMRQRHFGRAGQFLVILMGALLAAARPSQAEDVMAIEFGKFTIGALPTGFSTGLTGRGKAVAWTVVEDPSALSGRVLAEISADTTDYRFPLAIYDDQLVTNVAVTVRFKPVAGKVDRAAGIAVRLLDQDNYYVVRANALEDNVRFYRVVKGDRHQIEGVSLKIPSDKWQVLGLRAESDKFTVMLNGKELFTATDRIFTGPGLVPLWTKADSVTHFDQMVISRLQ